MKLGYLLGWSSIAILGACTTVYHLTPVKTEDSAAVAQPSPPAAEPLELEVATLMSALERAAASGQAEETTP